MTNEMKLQNEVLSMEELDNVNGATCEELHELTKALTSNNNVLNFFADAAELLSKYKAGCLGNIPLAYAMQSFLKNDLGINSNVSVGWGGSGFRETHNTYSDRATGASLSHADVLKRVRDYGKRAF